MCQFITVPDSLSLPIMRIRREEALSLWDFLVTVPDPRMDQGKRHPLPIVLLISILALCCGAQGYESIAEWGENYQEQIKRSMPFAAGHIPAASTFQRIFCRLDADAIEAVLSAWMLVRFPLQKGEGISLDGKTVGATGLHLVAAFSHRAKSVLFEKGTTTKGKELVVGPEVLSMVPLTDHVTTGDAMFAQRSISTQITIRGGGYVFTVKGNQETLEQDIHMFFKHPPMGARIETTTLCEKAKGMIVERTVEMSSDMNDYLQWPGLTHIYRVRREVTKKGKTTTDVAVGVARLLAKHDTVENLAALIRGHWSIENYLHRARDVVFGEDRSTIRTRHGPQMMAAIRNLIITVFYHANVESFPKKMRRFCAKPEELFAFWQIPAYSRLPIMA